MTTPEQHLDCARECLANGDIAALLGALQSFETTLQNLNPSGGAAAPSTFDGRPPVDGARGSSYAADSALEPARVEHLRSDVAEILEACQLRQRETLDELIALRSKGRSFETFPEESGNWFKGSA